jgi:mannose-1-phosphate guanylyltransferase
VPTDPAGRVSAFCEKDPNPVTDQINAGTYVFRREVVDAIPADRPVSVERETFPHLLSAGASVIGYLDAGYWRDLGRPADFVAGSADLVLGRVPSAALPGPTGPALVLDGAQVDPTAVLCAGTTVGAGCAVSAGAVVEGSVLFDGASVGAGSVVRRSAIGYGATLAAAVVVEDVVIGDRARLGTGVELLGGARVWPDVVLPDGAIRFSADT